MMIIKNIRKSKMTDDEMFMITVGGLQSSGINVKSVSSSSDYFHTEFDPVESFDGTQLTACNIPRDMYEVQSDDVDAIRYQLGIGFFDDNHEIDVCSAMYMPTKYESIIEAWMLSNFINLDGKGKGFLVRIVPTTNIKK